MLRRPRPLPNVVRCRPVPPSTGRKALSFLRSFQGLTDRSHVWSVPLRATACGSPTGHVGSCDCTEIEPDLRASRPTPLTFETSKLPANQVKADWPRDRPAAAARNARAGALEFLVSTGRGTGWPQRRASGGARRGSRGSIVACARGHWISTSTGTCKKQEFIAENHSGWGSIGADWPAFRSSFTVPAPHDRGSQRPRAGARLPLADLCKATEVVALTLADLPGG